MTAGLAHYRCDGPPDGRTLLFLHGLGGDHSNWAPQFDHFVPLGYRCIAWTLPGYGASAPLGELTWPALADSAVAVLDDVGADRAVVIGLSLGGYIAQQLAVDHPGRLDALVLAATTAQFGRGSSSFAEKFLAARLTPLDEGKTPADLAPAVVAGLIGPDAPEAIRTAAIRSMANISPDAYRRVLTLLVRWNLAERIGEIDAPTLCLAGSEDRTAPVAAVDALAAGIRSARFHVIEGCNHLMNLDRPREFDTAIERFLTDG